jgi:hypothetical protein
LVLAVAPSVRADDAALAKQRQTAEVNCRALQLSAYTGQEGRYLLVYGTPPAGRLKTMTAALEKQFAIAVKALQFDKDRSPWPGKLTVYVFTDRADYRSFVRTVEKRGPEDAEQGSARPRGDVPHVVAGPGRGKDAPAPEVEAGHQVAAALIAARAKDVVLPEWVVTGFARATAAHAAGTTGNMRKRAARNLAGRFKPSDVWSDETPPEVRQMLATAVMDYLVYGKGVAKPADFLAGFRPDDERPVKTAVDALAAASRTPEQFDLDYRRWLMSPH